MMETGIYILAFVLGMFTGASGILVTGAILVARDGER